MEIKKGQRDIVCPLPFLIPRSPSGSHSASILRRTQFLSPYFFLNFSTRPAASISFCLPVKKGWQFEQISTWIVATVERVSTTYPHAQLIVAFLYSGWMAAFMEASRMLVIYNIRRRALQIVEALVTVVQAGIDFAPLFTFSVLASVSECSPNL